MHFLWLAVWQSKAEWLKIHFLESTSVDGFTYTHKKSLFLGDNCLMGSMSYISVINFSMKGVNVQYEFLIPIDKRKITGIEKHTSRFFYGVAKNQMRLKGQKWSLINKIKCLSESINNDIALYLKEKRAINI